MSTVMIRGDEWDEQELRDLASKPRLDVPVKDEYGRRTRLAVHVWQAQHGECEGEQPEETPAAPEQTPEPEPEPAEPDAPHVYAHPCPRCGASVNGGRKDKMCDSCRAKAKKEQTAKCREKAKVTQTGEADAAVIVTNALALAVGTFGHRLEHAVHEGDAKAYRSAVDDIAALDRIITAIGGWEEEK